MAVAARRPREVLGKEDFAEVGGGGAGQRRGGQPQPGHEEGGGESEAPLGGRERGEGAAAVRNADGGDDQDGEDEPDRSLRQHRQARAEEGREDLRRRHLAVAGKEEGGRRQDEPREKRVDLAESQGGPEPDRGAGDQHGVDRHAPPGQPRGDGEEREHGQERADDRRKARAERLAEDRLPRLDEPHHERRLVGVDFAVAARDEEGVRRGHLARDVDEAGLVGLPVAAPRVLGPPVGEDEEEARDCG